MPKKKERKKGGEGEKKGGMTQGRNGEREETKGWREGKGQSAKQVTYKFLSRLAYGSTSARNPQSNILYP